MVVIIHKRIQQPWFCFYIIRVIPFEKIPWIRILTVMELSCCPTFGRITLSFSLLSLSISISPPSVLSHPDVPRESPVPGSISKSTRFLPFLSTHLSLQTNLASSQPFRARRSDRSPFSLQLQLFLSLKGMGWEIEHFLGTRPSLASRSLCCAFVLGLFQAWLSR